MKYEFLQVSDEMIDAQAPTLALLLTASGVKTKPAEALALILRLERYVLRRVDDSLPDVPAEMRACAAIPRERASHMLSVATGWSETKALHLVEALADPQVRVLDVTPEGWALRGFAERYARFIEKRKASRKRTRDNARARAQGWQPGEKKAWVHPASGRRFISLGHLIAHLDRETSNPPREAEGGAP